VLQGSRAVDDTWTPRELAELGLSVILSIVITYAVCRGIGFERRLRRRTAELEHERENLRLMFDATQVALLLVDSQGCVRRINQNAERLKPHGADGIGQQPGDVLSCINAMGQEKGCGFTNGCEECVLRRTLLQVLRTGEGVRNMEFRQRRLSEGEAVDVWFSINAAPVVLDGQSHVLLALLEITSLKAAERALAERTTLLTNLLDSIPDLVFFKDTAGVYMGCNPAFAEFVGRARGEIVGQTDEKMFGAELAEWFREHDSIMMREGRARQNEETIAYPDGRRVLLETLKSPLRTEDGHVIGLIGVSRDITARKEAEQVLRETNGRLE
jgi:PAS domain S-box-containing protein